MHKNFVAGFHCPVCPPLWLRAYFNSRAH